MLVCDIHSAFSNGFMFDECVLKCVHVCNGCINSSRNISWDFVLALTRANIRLTSEQWGRGVFLLLAAVSYDELPGTAGKFFQLCLKAFDFFALGSSMCMNQVPDGLEIIQLECFDVPERTALHLLLSLMSGLG